MKEFELSLKTDLKNGIILNEKEMKAREVHFGKYKNFTLNRECNLIL